MSNCLFVVEGLLRRFKAASNFISVTLVKVITGLFVIKFLALKLGPEGFGLLGQFMTLVAIVGMMAGGGVGNGLIKVLSQSPVNTKDGGRWLMTAFTLSVLFSVVVAFILLLFAKYLSVNLFSGYFLPVIIFVSCAQVIIGFGALIQAEASSRGDSTLFATINVLGVIIGAAVLSVAVTRYGLIGAAYGVAAMPVITGLVAIYFFVTRYRVLLAYCRLRLSSRRMRYLLSFSGLTIVGAISVPVAQIFIRDSMGMHLGWEQVGLWQGVVKISDVYMQFVGVILINYALPRFSSSDSRQSLIEFKFTLTWLLIALVVGFVFMFALREFIIILLFTEDFLPMSSYFLPQMVGDMFRTIGAAISFMFIARGLVKLVFIFEVSQGAILFVMFKFFEQGAGVMAPLYAHVASYVLIALAMGFLFLARVCKA